jgi:hypothetical protein
VAEEDLREDLREDLLPREVGARGQWQIDTGRARGLLASSLEWHGHWSVPTALGCTPATHRGARVTLTVAPVPTPASRLGTVGIHGTAGTPRAETMRDSAREEELAAAWLRLLELERGWVVETFATTS